MKLTLIFQFLHNNPKVLIATRHFSFPPIGQSRRREVITANKDARLGKNKFCHAPTNQASPSSHLPSEGQTPEEVVDLGVAGRGGRLAQPHQPPLGDGRLHGHAPDDPSTGLRVGHGPGGHRDVGGVLLPLQVTDCRPPGDELVFEQAGRTKRALSFSSPDLPKSRWCPSCW